MILLDLLQKSQKFIFLKISFAPFYNVLKSAHVKEKNISYVCLLLFKVDSMLDPEEVAAQRELKERTFHS